MILYTALINNIVRSNQDKAIKIIKLNYYYCLQESCVFIKLRNICLALFGLIIGILLIIIVVIIIVL